MKLLFVLVFSAALAFGQDQAKNGPLIFISGKAPVTATSGAGGVVVKGVALGGASTSYGGDDETMVIASNLLKKCPQLTLTVSEDVRPDYILLVNRTPGTFFTTAMSQFMLLHRDKSVLYANEKTSSMKASRDACKAILADWQKSNGGSAKAPQPAPANNQPASVTDGWWKAEAKK